MNRAARLDLIRDLREQSRRIESTPERTSALTADTPVALERLLSGQGFDSGTLIEWQNAGAGSGAVTLALAVAAQVLQRDGAMVVIDPAGEFYPPGLAGLGIPLDRTVLVRPDDRLATLWAWEQALRCRAVAVTLGWAQGWNDRLLHRFQLAAETGSGLGFLLRPVLQQAGPSKAAVRLRVTSLARNTIMGLPTSSLALRANTEAEPLSAERRRLRVEVLHCRGGTPGASAEVELGHATHPVHLVSQLADPALAAGPVHA
jgi:hypothetical protein